MRCARVKGQLSDYLDSLLDAERAALVENHLAKCGKCQEELEFLKTLIHELRSLEPVKAPDGFLASIHSRLEKENWWERVKAFLFIPARIRLPMELATLATTIIIVFFIFHMVPFLPSRERPATQPERTAGQASAPVTMPNETIAVTQERSAGSEDVKAPVLAFTPTEKSVSSTQIDEAKGSNDLMVRKDVGTGPAPSDDLKRSRGLQRITEPAAKPAPQAPPAQSEAGKKKSFVNDRKTDDLKIAEQEPTAAPKQEKINEEMVKTPGAFYGRVAIEAQPTPLVLHIAADYDKRTATSSGSPEVLSCLESPKKEEARPQPVIAKPQIQAKTGKELSKGKSVPAGVGPLRPAPLKTEADGRTVVAEIQVQIEKLVLALEGKISKTELNRETRQPEFLSIEIPIQNFQKLIAKLSEMGTLDVPVEPTAGSTPQTFLIRLQLVTPK